MPVIEAILPSISDAALAAGLEAVPAAGPVAARLAKTTDWTDDFDDASFDTSILGGPVTANGGTVTEAGGVLELDASGGANEEAFFWIKAAQDPTKLFSIKTRFRYTNAYAASGQLFNIQHTASPGVSANLAERAIAVYTDVNPSRTLYFSKWDAGGTRNWHSPNTGQGWRVVTDEDAFRWVQNTWYIFKFYSDATNWWFEIWDGDDTQALYVVEKITWADTYTPGGGGASYYFIPGHPFSGATGDHVMELDYLTYTVDDYSTSSDVMTFPWSALPVGTLGNIPLIENAIAALTGDTPGTLRYQAAFNGGAFGAVSVFTPDSITANTGSVDSGTVADLILNDGNKMIMGEVTGVPGGDYEFEFSPNVAPSQIKFNGHYNGNPAHNYKGRMFNYNSMLWVDVTANVTDLPSSSVDADHTWNVPSPNADYFSGGKSRFALVHVSSGNMNHKLNVDKLCLLTSVASWLTLAQLQAQVDGTVITDTAESFRLKVQFNSDSITRPDLTVAGEFEHNIVACDYPSEDDVRAGIVFNNTLSTGNLVLPGVGVVISGEGFGTNGTEFTGTYVEVSINDVEAGVTFGAGSSLTGVFVVPGVGVVLFGTGFGANGSEFNGTYVTVSINDVESGVTFGAGSVLTGVFVSPTEAQVLLGVGFGANATEFTGALAAAATFIVPLKVIDLTRELEVTEL